MTFSDARMECVANNGDLPAIENNADLEDVITNITATTDSGANSSTGLDVLVYQRTSARHFLFVTFVGHAKTIIMLCTIP